MHQTNIDTLDGPPGLKVSLFCHFIKLPMFAWSADPRLRARQDSFTDAQTFYLVCNVCHLFLLRRQALLPDCCEFQQLTCYILALIDMKPDWYVSHASLIKADAPLLPQQACVTVLTLPSTGL